jgi:hypothetical protein
VLLHALDTPAHAAATRARNDWFLYVGRAAAADGRSVYEDVLAEPAKLRRFAHREADLLLPVARNAYERRTGMLWEHQPPVSYESGSNTAQWGDLDPFPQPSEPSEPLEPLEPLPWLSLPSIAQPSDPATKTPLYAPRAAKPAPIHNTPLCSRTPCQINQAPPISASATCPGSLLI